MAILVKESQKERLIDELFILAKQNKPLYNILKDVAKYVLKFDEDAIVTHIFRKENEQKAIYGPKTERTSPHQLWLAFDLRSRNFNKKEIKEIEDYINNKYNDLNYFSKTCFFHEINAWGEHFHFQFVEKNA